MSDLEKLGIDIHSIEPNDDFMGELNKAIQTLREETLKNTFEVILNKNLIKVRETETNYRTILGCRISYKCLDKNISFIVKSDNKPTYEQLEDKINKYKEVINKLRELIGKYYFKQSDDYYDYFTEGVCLQDGDYQELEDILKEVE